MRPAGLTLAALLVGVTVVSGQQPVPPAPPGGGAPVAPPAPAAKPADPKLDEHLARWEKTMGDLANFRFVLGLKRTEPTFKSEKSYTGVVLCMKPNYAVVRLDNDADKDKKDNPKKDYEAYICDGKAVYEYNGLNRTITRWQLPDPKAGGPGATDNLMIDFLSGMKAKDAKDRFDLSLFKEDANYVYLDVKPKLGKDKAEFQQLRMALYGPNTKFAYLPAQVFLVKPNGDSEMWRFTDPQTNIPGLKPEHFAAQKVEGFEFKEGKPPTPAPPGVVPQPKLPGGTNLPPGDGAVRPVPKP